MENLEFTSTKLIMKNSRDKLIYKLETAEERIIEVEDGSKYSIQPDTEELLEKTDKKSVMG